VRELRAHGYKASQQRLAVLKALAAEPRQNIVELRWRCPRVGLMTIYRNLELFAELGLVQRLDLGDEQRYELTGGHLTT
jgi:Fur family ferric uptake transcriptional regulator